MRRRPAMPTPKHKYWRRIPNQKNTEEVRMSLMTVHVKGHFQNEQKQDIDMPH
jgi:hypothetical protein